MATVIFCLFWALIELAFGNLAWGIGIGALALICLQQFTTIDYSKHDQPGSDDG